jgi:competence transcription factor ComK
MVKRKFKRPPPPEPIIVKPINEVWVYYTRPTLIYPIPWKGWAKLEKINELKKLLENGTTQINFAKKRHKGTT